MRFAIDDHKQRAGRVELDDLDFGAFRDRPLPDDALRCLRYMHDVEHHTVCYLRDVLVTDAHRSHEITSFLSLWVFEEFWHGEALGHVLEAHGEPGSAARVRAVRDRSRGERVKPALTLLANGLTRHVPAVHMAWGAVNEWTTQAAYGRLAARTGHPVLRELLARIKKQEGRHIDFYATEAHRRLAPSPAAQRMARLALRWFWTPVGAGINPPSELRHLAGYLFGDAEGRAAASRIDRRVDGLPGLGGLRLATRSVNRLCGPARSADGVAPRPRQYAPAA